MSSAGAPYLRRDRSPLTRFDLGPEGCFTSLAAAYDALGEMARARPDRWAGWKLGGTNHASRAAFGVSEGYFGPIDREEVLVASAGTPAEIPAAAPGFALAELKGEVEVALRLGPDGETADAWAVALEMPSSPIRNLPEAGVAALVADRCAAGALVLGPPRTGPVPDLAAARFVQELNGQEAATGGMADLVASPAALLAEFVTLARRHAMPLAPGQWVATGGITPCIAYAANDRLRILVDGQAELDLIIGTGILRP